MNPDEKLHAYVDAVVNAPNSFALTATRDAGEFWKRHIEDALALIRLTERYCKEEPIKVLDVGTGNGIPGFPCAVMKQDWSVELLDSSNKKVGFLDMIRSKLVVNNLRTLVGRAEVVAHTDRRAAYDVVYSRALGKLPTAIELCAAFIKTNGLLIVPHGTSWPAELEASKKTMKEMGVILESSEPYFKSDDIMFTALIFKKTAETSENLPRNSKAIGKGPL